MSFPLKTKCLRCLFASRAAVSIFVLGSFAAFSPAADTNSVATISAPTQSQALNWFLAARSNYLAQAGNATSAWKFAEACFEWAEYATNSTQREALATEGIAAAKAVTEMHPDTGVGHFFLAMNKGQLARTKSLGALALVKEMEQSFIRAIKLDPTFDYAAPHRSLGTLYLDAPGWPASIGSKSKARKHLEKAVELAPDYPTNHLTLLDAYLRWGDTSALAAAVKRYRAILPKAKEKYTGPVWQNSWRNWDSEWRTILEKSEEL